ncbi:hypothetical protein H4219_000012 [Mycoemilia scoparia]|uniref:TPX2 C-terminal domain-containing protein n=1 Tax=Mycoemilia scoparia TaxID=417184 RepID=A0A9W8DXA0_9FUNG|nr:hypothetical protein H4219_000012 [Mycoemilia scoparia]
MLSEDSESDWDFDAPKFYNFDFPKTPGKDADKWFEQRKATPAPKRLQRHTEPDDLSSELLSDNESSEDVGDSGVYMERENSDHSSDEASSEDSESFEDQKEISGSPVSSTAEISFNIKRDSQNFDSASPPSKRQSNQCSTSGHLVTHNGHHERKKNAMVVKMLTIPKDFSFARPTESAMSRKNTKKDDHISSESAISGRISKPRHKVRSLTVPQPFRFHSTRTRALVRAAEEHAATEGSVAEKRSLAEKVKSYINHAKTASPNRPTKPRQLTRPVAPNFSTDTRIKSRINFGTTELKEANGKNTGNPRPTKTSDQQKTKLKKQPSLTIPKSPKLHKSRIRKTVEQDSNDDLHNVAFKTSKIKAQDKPLAPQQQHSHTEVKPFNFKTDSVVQRKLDRLREELDKARKEEEEKRNFKAQPMPSFSPEPVLPIKKRKTTKHTPFSLLTDLRGEEYRKRLIARIEELEERRRERARFKAQNIPASLERPFVPHPSDHPLTQVEEVIMNTELRSEDRHAWEEERMERERIRQEILMRHQKEDEMRELEELKILRQALVHKPEPIMKYKPTIIKPSDQKLTVPKTPKWHNKRKRSMARTPKSQRSKSRRLDLV